MKVNSELDGLLDCEWVGGCMILSIRKKEITRIETNEQTDGWKGKERIERNTRKFWSWRKRLGWRWKFQQEKIK